MIANYLVMTATHERKLGTVDLHGNLLYGSPTIIKCRIRRTNGMEISDHGIVFNYNYVVHTDAVVDIGDKINGMEVKSIESLVNYAGVTIGVVAYA